MGYEIHFNENDIELLFFEKLSDGCFRKQFLNLIKNIYNRDMPIEIYLWYEKLSQKNLWTIVKEKKSDKFIGLYGLLPIDFFINNKIISGYLCHNVGVVSDYKGKGLFAYIGEKTLEKTLNQNNIALGFPNKFALKGHCSIGWNVLSEMITLEKTNEMMIKDSDNDNIILSKNLDIQESQLDKFYSKVKFGVYKNLGYYKWRLSRFGSNFHKYIYILKNEILGLLIFKDYFDNITLKRKVHIVEIKAHDENIFQKLIQKCENYCYLNNVNILNSWVYDNSREFQLLSKAGFFIDKNSWQYPTIIFSKNSKIVNEIMCLSSSDISFSYFDNDVY